MGVPDLVLQTKLNPTIEQQATTFFFNNFMVIPRSKETTRGFLEVAAPMYERAKSDSPLHLAIEAMAISVITNWPGRRHLTQLAARLTVKRS